MSSPSGASSVPTWSISIPEPPSADGSSRGGRTVLWSGGVDSIPSIQELHVLFSSGWSENVTLDVATQILRQAPVKFISSLLSCLTCNYWRNKSAKIDMRMLNSLKSDSQSVCGCVFKKGDIVWSCRQCAKDSSCVQCDECFRDSDHKGHEVYFYKSSGNGGSCDCGDHDAWLSTGNCSKHGRGDQTKDPLAEVPLELQKGMRAVVQGIVGVLISQSVCSVRGLELWERNEYVNDLNKWPKTSKLSLRLHNDDCHSYDDVTGALKSIGLNLPQAQVLTESVDKIGEAEIGKEFPTSARLREIYQKIRCPPVSLIFSMAPGEVVAMEQRVLAAWGWLRSIGTTHPGFCRIVSEILFTEVIDFPEACAALPQSPHTRPAAVFDIDSQFPSQVNLVEEIGQTQAFRAHMAREYHSMFPDAQLFDWSCCRRPFDFAHRNAMSVLMLATPHASKALKKAVNDLMLVFQHDQFFKLAYSQSLTVLYPSLLALYVQFYGSEDHTIFNTTVQMYTSNSVVAALSSHRVETGRVLRDRVQPPMPLTRTLTAALLAAYTSTGCSSARKSDAFLNAQAGCYAKNRLVHVIRDLEYTFENPVGTLHLLAGERDPGVLEDWLYSCYVLQGLDKHKRYVRSHVEMESDRWQIAAQFVFQCESVSTQMVMAAFATPESKIISTSTSQSASPIPADDTVSSAELSTLRKRALLAALGKACDVMTFWQEKQHAEPSVALPPPLVVASIRWLGVQVAVVTKHQELAIPVSSAHISIHIPINRFIAKLIKFAAYGTGSSPSPLAAAIRYLERSSAQLWALADCALQALVFAAQAACNMWVRNGSSAINLAYNYSRVPLSGQLRDNDLVAVQCAMAAMGPDTLLHMITHRFEIAGSLVSGTMGKEGSPTLSEEHQGFMLAEMLLMLIQLVSAIPSNLLGSTAAGGVGDESSSSMLDAAIAREAAHCLLRGVQSMRELQTAVIQAVGWGDAVGEDTVRVAVDGNLLVVNSSGGGDNSKRALGESSFKPAVYELFDPEYINLNAKQKQVCIDKVRAYRAKYAISTPLKGDQQPEYVPLLSSKAIATPHDDLAFLRLVLYRPLTIKVLHAALSLASGGKGSGFSSSAAAAVVINRVIHLLTLQLHCWHSASDVWSTFASADIDDSSTSASSNRQDLWAGVDDYFTTCFHVDGYGVGLLRLLADLWNSSTGSGLVFDDALYRPALGWVLHQLSDRSVAARSVLRSEKAIVFKTAEERAAEAEAAATALAASANGNAGSGDNSKTGSLGASGGNPAAAAARRRALAKMQKQAASFASSMNQMNAAADIVGGDEDDEDISSEAADSSQRLPPLVSSLEDNAPECMLCMERSGEALCYLGLLQPSHLVRHATERPDSSDYPSLKLTYRVVSLSGCRVFANNHASTAHAKVIGLLPFGAHVLVESRVGHWVKLAAPLFGGGGWARICEELGPENQALRAAGMIARPLLHPIVDFMYARHGSARAYATSCGHCMHAGCWSAFYASSLSAELNSMGFEGRGVVDVKNGELLCPLCKTIANCVIPHVPPHISREILPRTSRSASTTELIAPSPLEVLKRYSHLSADFGTDHDFSGTPWVKRLFDHSAVRAFATSYQYSDDVKGRLYLDACLQLYRLPFRREPGAEMVPEISDHGPLKLIRSVHSAFANLGYTVQCQVAAGRWSETKINEDGLQRDRKLLGMLVTTVRHVNMWFKNTSDYEALVASPLNRLLFSRSISERCSSPTNAAAVTGILRYLPSDGEKLDGEGEMKMLEDLKAALQETPMECVNTCRFPGPRRISLLQSTVMKRTKELHCGDVSEMRHVGDLWPVFSLPLLAQDLHMIAAACIATGAGMDAIIGALVPTVALARLVQILLEPRMTGVGNCHASSSNTTHVLSIAQFEDPLLVSQLTNLRDRVCSDVGIVPTGGASVPGGFELVNLVFDSWIPFLEACCQLVTCASEASEATVHRNAPPSTSSPSSLMRFVQQSEFPAPTSGSDYLHYLLQFLRLEAFPLMIGVPVTKPFAGDGTGGQTSPMTLEGGCIGDSDEETLSIHNGFMLLASTWCAQYRDYYRDRTLAPTATAVSWVPVAAIEGLDRSSKTRSGSVASSDSTPLRPSKHAKYTNAQVPKAAATAATGTISTGSNNEDEMAIGENNGSSQQRAQIEGDGSVEDDDPLLLLEPTGQRDSDAMMDIAGGGMADDIDDAGDDGNDEAFGDSDDDEVDDEDDEALFDDDDENGDDDDHDGIDPGDDEHMEVPLQNLFAQGGDQAERDLLQQMMELFGNGGNVPPGMAPIIELLQARLHQPVGVGAGGSGAGGALHWKLYGCDPMNMHYDEHALTMFMEGHPTLQPVNANGIASFHMVSPLQSTLTGHHAVFGISGERLNHSYPDLSHLGMPRRIVGGFVPLPSLYTDVYKMAKFPEGANGITLDEPAICLVCGKILNAGNRPLPSPCSFMNAGECTLHARSCGLGVGVFFLAQRCTVLLVRGGISVMQPSIYVDDNGEVAEGRGRNRPLFLSERRYLHLQDLYFRHEMVKEIIRQRLTEERSIRQYWY